MAATKASVVKGVHVTVGGTDLSELILGLPDLSKGEPEKVEATTLNDEARVYVPGIRDLGDSLAIECLYTTEKFGTLSELEDGTAKEVSIKFKQDSLTFTFSASVSVTYVASEVGGLRKMTVNLTPASEITVAKGTVLESLTIHSKTTKSTEGVK